MTPDVTQPDCPPLALSPFFLSLLFPQKSHHFGVNAVRSHSHTVFCFNSVFMLSAHFPSLFISLLTFCSHTNLAGCPDSSCQWSRSESQRVCLPKDCLRGLWISCSGFFLSLLNWSIIDVLHEAKRPRFDQQSCSFFLFVDVILRAASDYKWASYRVQGQTTIPNTSSAPSSQSGQSKLQASGTAWALMQSDGLCAECVYLSEWECSRRCDIAEWH